MQNKRNRSFLSVRELVLFPVLGVLMFLSVLLTAVVPNVHLIGMLVIVFTLTLRWKALIPIYIFVFLVGLYFGFTAYWTPYIYVWTILWAVTMLLPKEMPKAVKAIVYPMVCCMHGLFFGVLCALLVAPLVGANVWAWVVPGISYDIIHGIGNLAAGMLIMPLSTLVDKLYRQLVRSA